MEGRKKLAPDNEGYALYSFHRFLEAQKQSGYQAMTLWGGSPHIYVDCYGHEDLAKIRQELQAYEINPVCYRPQMYGYTLYAENGSLLDEATLDYYRYSAEVAANLNIPIMLVGLGKLLGDQDEDRQKDLAIHRVRHLAQECGNQGIRLALIAGAGGQGQWMSKPQGLQEFMERAGGANLGIALDLKAVCRPEEPEVASPDRAAKWFECFGNDICYVSIGDGPMTLVQEAEKLGYQGYCGCMNYPVLKDGRAG